MTILKILHIPGVLPTLVDEDVAFDVPTCQAIFGMEMQPRGRRAFTIRIMRFRCAPLVSVRLAATLEDLNIDIKKG